MLVQAVAGKPEQDLHRGAQTEDGQQIAGPVGGVGAALCDHIGEDRVCKPADDAQDPVVRQQQRADMVHSHHDQGKKLELVGGQFEFPLFHSATFKFQ